MYNTRDRCKADKLVYGSKDEYCRQDIHEPGDERGGHEGKDETEHQTAYAHDGEMGFHACELTALGVKHLWHVFTATRTKVSGARHHPRQEKHHTNDDGHPCYRLLAIFYQQGTNDHGA